MNKKLKKSLYDCASGVYDKVRDGFDDGTIGFIASIISIILIIAAFVFIISIVPFITGWAVLTVIGLFTTVGATGYWATAAIGLAVIIVVNIVS